MYCKLLFAPKVPWYHLPWIGASDLGSVAALRSQSGCLSEFTISLAHKQWDVFCPRLKDWFFFFFAEKCRRKKDCHSSWMRHSSWMLFWWCCSLECNVLFATARSRSNLFDSMSVQKEICVHFFSAQEHFQNSFHAWFSSRLSLNWNYGFLTVDMSQNKHCCFHRRETRPTWLRWRTRTSKTRFWAQTTWCWWSSSRLGADTARYVDFVGIEKKHWSELFG